MIHSYWRWTALQMFDFNPLETICEIKLAFSYSPKILESHNSKRTSTSLLYILNGEYNYSSEKSSFTAGSNSLVYLPANSIPYSYRISKVGESPVSAMQIEFDLLDSLSKNPIVYSTHPTLLTDHAEDSISDCFKTIIDTYTKNDTSARLLLMSEFFKLLSLCTKFSSNSQISTSYQKIAPAIEYIQSNYKNSFTILELAKLCHISESQLRRIFQNEIGMSPIRYKNKILLQHACSFLKNDTFNIGEISEILGFCDIYTFSHFFYNYKGISPKAYQKSQSRQTDPTMSCQKRQE